jgi:two-component system, cell cycle response regulator DivK
MIEDNEQNRYLATYLLEHHGYDVVAANNGREGLAFLRDSSADLILLDIQLPDMDGYQIAAALKSEAHTANIPLVAVSSFAMAGDRQRALKAGCDGYIEKPIDPDRFIQQLQQYIRSK